VTDALEGPAAPTRLDGDHAPSTVTWREEPDRGVGLMIVVYDDGVAHAQRSTLDAARETAATYFGIDVEPRTDRRGLVWTRPVHLTTSAARTTSTLSEPDGR